MFEDPIFSLLSLGAGGFFLWMWIQDLQKKGSDSRKHDSADALPGCSTCSRSLAVLAIIVGAVWVLSVSGIETVLGLQDDQSTISWLFLAAMLGAAVTEEVIFRGYLVISNRGPWALWGSILLFSILFALIHPYMWFHVVEEPSGIEWITKLRFGADAQGYLSAASVLALSLLLYLARFNPLNPNRSLIPCFLMHGTANLSVFIIKYLQGYVE